MDTTALLTPAPRLSTADGGTKLSASPALTPRVIRIDAIRLDEHQVRQTPSTPEEMESLRRSIAEVGVLQPVVVKESPEPDCFDVIAGHRRLTAAKAAGLKEILCLVAARPLGTADVRRWQWAENQERSGLNPIDQAKLFRELRRSEGWSQSRIAKFLGISQGHVSEYLELLKLPTEVQDRVAKGTLSVRGAKAQAARLKKADTDPEFEATTQEPGPFASENPLDGIKVHAAESWIDSSSRLMFVVGRRSKRPVTAEELLRALKKRVRELEAKHSVPVPVS